MNKFYFLVLAIFWFKRERSTVYNIKFNKICLRIFIMIINLIILKEIYMDWSILIAEMKNAHMHILCCIDPEPLLSSILRMRMLTDKRKFLLVYNIELYHVLVCKNCFSNLFLVILLQDQAFISYSKYIILFRWNLQIQRKFIAIFSNMK